jgi:hypothetical protein
MVYAKLGSLKSFSGGVGPVGGPAKVFVSTDTYKFTDKEWAFLKGRVDHKKRLIFVQVDAPKPKEEERVINPPGEEDPFDGEEVVE